MSLVWMDGLKATETRLQIRVNTWRVGMRSATRRIFRLSPVAWAATPVKSVSGGYYLQTPALTTNSTLIASFGYQTDYALNQLRHRSVL